jgi:hypothetical protein
MQESGLQQTQAFRRDVWDEGYHDLFFAAKYVKNPQQDSLNDHMIGIEEEIGSERRREAGEVGG